MDSDHQDFDINIQEEDEYSNIESRRKAIEKSVEEPSKEPSAKKIWVNINNNPIDSTKKLNFVWDYFQVEDGVLTTNHKKLSIY